MPSRPPRHCHCPFSPSPGQLPALCPRDHSQGKRQNVWCHFQLVNCFISRFPAPNPPRRPGNASRGGGDGCTGDCFNLEEGQNILKPECAPIPPLRGLQPPGILGALGALGALGTCAQAGFLCHWDVWVMIPRHRSCSRLPTKKSDLTGARRAPPSSGRHILDLLKGSRAWIGISWWEPHGNSTRASPSDPNAQKEAARTNSRGLCRGLMHRVRRRSECAGNGAGATSGRGFRWAQPPLSPPLSQFSPSCHCKLSSGPTNALG